MNQVVDGAFDKLPIPPSVKAEVKAALTERIDLLLNAKGPGGQPLAGLKSEAGLKGTLQFDLVVETADGNPLDVKSLEVYVGLKGAVSASEAVTLPNLPGPVGRLLKGKADISAQSSAFLSVRYEAPANDPPPQPIDRGDSFVRLNHGDTHRAFTITEELLQEIASVRYADGSVEDGIAVTSGTSVWDLSRVADGRSHGHASLDLVNTVNRVLAEEGALAPGEHVANAAEAKALLRDVFALADPQVRADLAGELANPLRLDFGIEEVAEANRSLGAKNGPLPTARHFRDYF